VPPRRYPHFLLFLLSPLNGVNQGNALALAQYFFAIPRATGQHSPDDAKDSFVTQPSPQ